MTHSLVTSESGCNHIVIPLDSELQDGKDIVLCFCEYKVKSDDGMWDVAEIPDDICKTCKIKRENFGLA